MNDPNLTPKPDTQDETPPTPLRCLIGAIISGGVGYGCYLLMVAIATSFANKPIHSDNQLALRISSAVRTLVLGVATLGTGIFALVTLGLLALAIQLLFQGLTKKPEA
ncbi:MAG: DUF3082 domain-containing protein [Nostocaceae cyanobacterium]|nr:DUF3082 domain-containing protein [Nostocaceae cyanobacterium]